MATKGSTVLGSINHGHEFNGSLEKFVLRVAVIRNYRCGV